MNFAQAVRFPTDEELADDLFVRPRAGYMLFSPFVGALVVEYCRGPWKEPGPLHQPVSRAKFRTGSVQQQVYDLMLVEPVTLWSAEEARRHLPDCKSKQVSSALSDLAARKLVVVSGAFNDRKYRLPTAEEVELDGYVKSPESTEAR